MPMMKLVDGEYEFVLRAEDYEINTRTSPVIRSSYEFTPGSVRAVVEDAVAQDGSIDRTRLRGAGSLRIDLTILNTASGTKHQWLDDLAHFMDTEGRFYVVLKEDGQTEERRILVRPETMPRRVDPQSRHFMKITMSFVAPTGAMESVKLYEVNISPPTGLVGRTYPRTYTYTGRRYPSGNISTVATINVRGGKSIAPTYRIYGACSDPVIRNVDTGQVLALTGISIPQGHYIDIDVASRSVVMDSDPELSYLNKVDWSRSSWWYLPRGENKLTLSTSSQSAGCIMYIYWRERWI